MAKHGYSILPASNREHKNLAKDAFTHVTCNGQSLSNRIVSEVEMIVDGELRDTALTEVYLKGERPQQRG